MQLFTLCMLLEYTGSVHYTLSLVWKLPLTPLLLQRSLNGPADS